MDKLLLFVVQLIFLRLWCYIQDERYSADEQQYDWYQDFKGLERYLAPYLKQIPDFEILVAGCGNSSKVI